MALYASAQSHLGTCEHGSEHQNFICAKILIKQVSSSLEIFIDISHGPLTFNTADFLD